MWGKPIHAQTTDRILIAADNGRVFTLSGDKLPGGRGFGEPVRLTIDLEAASEIVAMMVVRPDTRLLVASSDGRGFVTSGEATLAETRKGKQLMNLRERARVNEAMDWINTQFYRDFGYGLVYPQLFPHQKQRSDEAQAACLERGQRGSQRWLKLLDEHWIGDRKPYLCGDSVTIADYLGSGIVSIGDVVKHRIDQLQFERDQLDSYVHQS